MQLDQSLLARIGQAVTENRVATREDLLENYKNEIVVRSDNMGYFNPRVTAGVDSLSTIEVTHLKFIPMHEDGIVVVCAASADESGAMEFTRFESRRTGMVNLRLALNGFQVQAAEGRKLAFPVSMQSITVNGSQRQVLVFQVKKPDSRKTRKVTRAKKAEQPTGTPVEA